MFSKKQQSDSINKADLLNDFEELEDFRPLLRNTSSLEVIKPRETLKEKKEKRKLKHEIRLQVKVGEHIIKEENKFKTALLERGEVPLPCYCGKYCDYRYILKQMVNAFNKLYETYEDLYVDYYVLYTNDETIPEDMQTEIKFSKIFNKKIEESNNENTNNFLNPVFSFIYDKTVASIGRKTTNNQNIEKQKLYEQVYEDYFVQNIEHAIHVNDQAEKIYVKKLARIQVIKNSKPIFIRVLQWVLPFFTGEMECICFHCTDRDNLDIYRTAIKTLYKEYMAIYLDFLGLYYAAVAVHKTDSSKIVQTTAKYEISKTKTDEFFKSTFEDLIVK